MPAMPWGLILPLGLVLGSCRAALLPQHPGSIFQCLRLMCSLLGLGASWGAAGPRWLTGSIK